MASSLIVNRWSDGLQWIADPDEFLQRASHVVFGDAGSWLIDPLDAPGVDSLLAEPDGEVQGVVLTLDRHQRDARMFADRYDVSVYLPEPVMHRADAIDAPIKTIDGFVEDTSFQALTVLDRRLWGEVTLYSPHEGTLIVGDALGTAPYFSPPGERLSVHPLLRLWPPREAFRDLTPDRVLVGHGPGLMEDATPALTVGLRNARKGAPAAYLNAFRHLVRAGRTLH